MPRGLTPVQKLAALALLLLTWITAAGADAQSTQPPASSGVPVRLDGETLFYIHAPLAAFSPEERARAAEKRLLLIADDPFYSNDLFSLREEPGRVVAMYRDEVVGVVTDQEAAGTAGGAPAYASQALLKVKAAIEQHRQRLLPAARARSITWLGVATVLLAVILYGIGRVSRNYAARIAKIRSSSVALLQRRALRFFKIGLTVAAILAYVEIAFFLIPLTRAFGLTVLDYLAGPVEVLWHGFLMHISDFAFIFVVIVLTKIFLKFVRFLLDAVAEGTIQVPFVSPAWALPFYKIVRLVTVAMAAVTIYPYIPGSSTEAFKGVGLVGGALLTLGASGTAGNFIGGLVLIFTDTFRIGDWAKVGDVTGQVVETNLLITRILTIKNEVVTIPNSTLIGDQLVNYSTRARREGLILHTSVTIGYDAPWRKVHELLIDAALRTPQIVENPRPFVLQTALNDFFVSYEINAFTRTVDQMPFTYSALHQNIQDAFNAAGVEIMSPHYASLRDGNATTIPEGREPPETARRFVVSVDQPRNPL
jgi:small-conductance mechanosensitive channel